MLAPSAGVGQCVRTAAGQVAGHRPQGGQEVPTEVLQLWGETAPTDCFRPASLAAQCPVL